MVRTLCMWYLDPHIIIIVVLVIIEEEGALFSAETGMDYVVIMHKVLTNNYVIATPQSQFSQSLSVHSNGKPMSKILFSLCICYCLHSITSVAVSYSECVYVYYYFDACLFQLNMYRESMHQIVTP